MSKMHLREATLADIPRMADIWSVAFFDDGFYDVIYPRRKEFLDDYRKMWTRKLAARFLEPKDLYLVVETDVVDATSGQSQKEVVGWGSWGRRGSSEAAMKFRAERVNFLKAFERRLVSLQQRYITPIVQYIQGYPGDRFADADKLEQFSKEWVEIVLPFWTGDIEEHWHLGMMAVDPKWQKKGIGRIVVQWGLDMAQKEGVPAGLESSEMGNPWYLKMGFVEISTLYIVDRRVKFPMLIWRPNSRDDSKILQEKAS